MAKIWGIADLHLSFGTPDKKMDIFGKRWINHAERVKENWLKLIKKDDLVLIPGDISWGMTPEQALPDLLWIHDLPGTKVMVKGNHDYWWTSLKKLEPLLPSSIHLLQNNSFVWNDIGIGGARLWDNIDDSFDEYIEFVDNPKAKKLHERPSDQETVKIYNRELQRLETSLKSIPSRCEARIALLHYPPTIPTLRPSPVTALLEKYRINACLFGHIHSLKQNVPIFGPLHGIQYIFVACDYLDCIPTEIVLGS